MKIFWLAIFAATGALAVAQDEQAVPVIHDSGPNILQRAEMDGVVCLGGLAAMALALALVVVWPYVTHPRRRPWRVLAASTLCLGIGGYVAYDWPYVMLNLAIRDAQKIREDCDQLIRHYKAAGANQKGAWSPANAELPASIARLGAESIIVNSSQVVIGYIPKSTTSQSWGAIYDPAHTHKSATKRRN